MTQPHSVRSFQTTLVGAMLVVAGIGLGQWTEDSIDVGGAWVGSLAYNSRADVVYGSCQYINGRFFAIDCATNGVTVSFTQVWPRHIAYDSTDNKAYCTFSADGDDSVLVVDGNTHRRLRAIPVAGAVRTVWDPVGNRLYVSGGDGANLVTVIDCRTDSVIATIPTGACPITMHLSTRRRKLYVQNHDAASVSIVSTESNTELRRVSVGGTMESGCYSAAVDKFYVDGHFCVKVIDGQADTIVGQIPLPVGSGAVASAANADEPLVFLGVEDWVSYSAVHVIDAVSDTVVSVLPIPRGPQSMFWSNATNRVYCANIDGWLTVVAGDGSRVVGTLAVAESPFVFARSAPRNRLFVGHLNSRRVYVVRDVVGVAEGPGRASPAAPAWHATPSPFRTRVTVAAAALGGCHVAVHAPDGRLVRRLDANTNGTVVWDGRDDGGREVPAGAYVVTASYPGAGSVVVVKSE